MSYRSSLSFVVTDQYLTEVWPMDAKLSVFRTFSINCADIEMKLCQIVFNNELQIKFEFCRYWSIFDHSPAEKPTFGGGTLSELAAILDAILNSAKCSRVPRWHHADSEFRQSWLSFDTKNKTMGSPKFCHTTTYGPRRFFKLNSA
jgi:hypothetical protein